MPTVLTPDVFSPVLLVSESLNVSLEQKRLIREILDTACSDSAFADKAYRAIEYILVAGSVNPPMITQLVPSSAQLSFPTFDMHVLGTGFDEHSVIVFAGQEERTFFVSAYEIGTTINMDLWKGADEIPVYVKSPAGVASDVLMFTFTEAGSGGVLSAKIPPVKPLTTDPSVPVGHNPPTLPHGTMEKK